MAGLDINADALTTPARKRRVWSISTGSRFGYIILALILMGPVVAFANYYLFSNEEIAGLPRTVIFIATLSYVLVLVTVIGVHLTSVVLARRRNSAGSQLHLKLTGMFAFVALVPTVIVATFATLMVDFGIERWFSERVGSIIRNSLVTAEAYEKEHLSVLIRNVELMQNELNQAAGRLTPAEMREYFREQSIHRNLDEAFMFSSDFSILARGEFSYLFTFEEPTQDQLDRARGGEMVLIDDNINGEIRALVHLSRFQDAFLYVTRAVQGDVLRLLDQTRETVQFYDQIERDRNDLLIGYAVQYIALSILVILSSILLGLWFAERLSRPVGRLAGAADAIGRGNLNVRVKEGKGTDEIALLSRAFNRMTSQVKDQRDALIRARDETERRRHLIEAVLSGVTAGVVGLDSEGRVDLINDAAAEMLGVDPAAITGQRLIEGLPAFGELVEAASNSPSGLARGEIRFNLRGEPKEFLAQIASKSPENPREGYVMTFDDVTALVSAQRMAAWGDIARRIAHEIKNPLTPIQLSADRMRRKFASRLGDDSTRFEEYIDVITRQAGDIRRMVDEFSKFARLPEPEMKEENLVDIVEKALILQREGRSDISYDSHYPAPDLPMICDRGLINQCLVNLLQNAADAIDGRHAEKDAPKGRIVVQLTVGHRNYRLMVIDNGLGLPEENRDRLKEPYVTNRASGTGLGLSIVSRIVEQHGGEISLSDADGLFDQDGAMVEVRLPRPLERTENRSKSDP